MNSDIIRRENVEESSESIGKEYNNQNNPDANKNRRKRRSKHVQEGRVYQCECGKAYLSVPALNNHKNSKHSVGGGAQEKRPRGRPRKYHVQDPKQFDNELNKFNNFFNQNSAGGYRTKTTEELFNIPDVIKLVFDDIFVPYGDKCFKRPDNFTDHPLLERLFLEKEASPDDKPKNENTCDEIFYLYLNYIKNLTNKNYFILALKFVILFRECLNISRQKEIVSDLENGVQHIIREYTAVRNGETVPEICNEFVTDFLENNDYFGINSERDRNELIELIQHFCTWLYMNGYTQSRLSLVS